MNLSRLIAGWSLLFALQAPLAADQPMVDVSKLPPPAKGKMDFRRDIEPIFQNSCLHCHGPDKARGGLRLDVGKHALEGGDSGVVIVPGNANVSRLIHFVGGLDRNVQRSEEHTSELQSLAYLVCRLLLE